MATRAKPSLKWKRGRGKLGAFAPLAGEWRAKGDSPAGPFTCTRVFAPILGGKFIQLDARWRFKTAKGDTPRTYDECCIFGPDKDGGIGFWSFTSDGKRSEGRLAGGTDLHPLALCFEAQMDAGLARQAYWPEDDGGVRWVVESKTRKGWSLLASHLYMPA